MDELLSKIGQALLTQCGLTTTLLIFVTGGLVWWILGQRAAYRELEQARDADRAASMTEAQSRSKAFEGLAVALSEMKALQAAQGTLLAIIVGRK